MLLWTFPLPDIQYFSSNTCFRISFYLPFRWFVIIKYFVNFIFKLLSLNPGSFSSTSVTIDATKGEYTAIWTFVCIIFGQVELVDMHYGTETDPTYDASLFEDHLHEIRECHRVSRGCFFLVIIFAYWCNVYENESSKSYLFIYVYLWNCGCLRKLSASHTIWRRMTEWLVIN